MNLFKEKKHTHKDTGPTWSSKFVEKLDSADSWMNTLGRYVDE